MQNTIHLLYICDIPMHEYTLYYDVPTTHDVDYGKEDIVANSPRSGRALHLFINSHINFSKRIFILNNISVEGSVERRRGREIRELLVFEDVYKIKQFKHTINRNKSEALKGLVDFLHKWVHHISMFFLCQNFPSPSSPIRPHQMSVWGRHLHSHRWPTVLARRILYQRLIPRNTKCIRTQKMLSNGPQAQQHTGVTTWVGRKLNNTQV